ncbi:MAG: hypothetical protein H0V66_15795 [Bdellovibrionales bacterium]|nr:hypothetical protein [Bdellovibrionales bacterium]
MNQFKIFQEALEKMYPSLTVFSDLDWDEVSQEYIASHDERPKDVEQFVFNFPQYLQDKAVQGDSPAYLFELAFFELLQNQVLETDVTPPKRPGIYLNPTLSFLNLEYDVSMMIDEATKGNVQIIERPHVLCIYRHPQRGLHHVDITTPKLEVLQELEAGPLKGRSNLPSVQQGTLHDLIELGMVMEVSASV